jgi:hypothetical protein
LYQESGGVRQAVSGGYVLEGNGQVGFQVGAYDHSKALVIDPVLSCSTYLGGSSCDNGSAIAVDGSGNAYVTGTTESADFPTTAGAYQTIFRGNASTAKHNAFIAKLNAAGTALVYSTYLGGNSQDYGCGIAVDTAGNPYVTGATRSTNFPATPGAFQTVLRAPPSPSGGNYTNAFVAKISPNATFPLVVTGFPSPTTAGVAGTFTVTAQNADGTTNTGYTGTVHFTSTDPQTVLPPDYTFTAADQGVYTFNSTLKSAGIEGMFAIDATTPTINGGQISVQVNPAAASRFVLSGPSSVTAGTAFSLTVTALDAYGNTATGYRGTVHFTSSDSKAVLPGNYTFTASDNSGHTFSGVKLRTKGTKTITASDTQSGPINGSTTIQVN